MDIGSALKSEVLRPIVITVIPGSFALFPYLILLNHRFPELATYRDAHESVYFTLTALAVVAAGLVLEDLGSRVESHWDSRLKREPEFPDFDETWNAYLRTAFEREPIGQRYLRTILLRVKFELGFGISLLPFGLGCWLANSAKQWFSCSEMVVFTVLMGALAVYMLVESYCGSRLLAEVRRTLVGVRVGQCRD